MMSTQILFDSLDFELPADLEAKAPPEARGLQRDDVRLMVSYLADNHIEHTKFRNVVDFLEAGDLVVINTSGTMSAALKIHREDGLPLDLHVSTRLPDGNWVIELRQHKNKHHHPFYDMQSGDKLLLPDGSTAEIISAYQAEQAKNRLWIAHFELEESMADYLAHYGFPIRYNYVQEPWPIHYYQTVYATELGSAEMPSAGRAFTPEIITRLIAKGVQVAPLILHTGVASLEADETPYSEYYRVPSTTARLINLTRENGGRIIAIGTTVVRALETVTDENTTHHGEGWTDIYITPERGIRSVDAMLTGLHEPRATHLAMLEALANREHLQQTYTAALDEHYLWHEFGDLHLILP